MKKTTLLALCIPAFIAMIAFFPVKNKSLRFHTEAERGFFREHGIDAAEKGPGNGLVNLVIDSNVLFPTAKTCGGCHGFDPNFHASITTSGIDVNVYDDWRSTMMANSAKDPFWRAKVSHEMLVNSSHSLELQDKCTSCHAPAGHYQAKLHDHKDYYLLADLYGDTLGLDGVTCQACHAQSPDMIGDLHSGQLNFDTNHLRVAYGPYEFLFEQPMHEFVGITPKFGPHIADAGLCAGCHTLITHTVDLDGMPTGGTFVEQATYHEWLNSQYDEDHENRTCQSCHIPELQDEIIISANYLFLTPKFPFGLHEMAGANATMLRLLKANREALDIDALPEHFDSTIAATLRMLQEKTLDFSLETGVLNGDSAYFDVRLINKAGHKFPSGYPSRRAWIEFEVKDHTGAVVFHSGAMNPDFSLPDEDANFEPHYNEIGAPGQVQIYELMPGDLNGNFTNVLERGHLGLKDNRLTPKGFSILDPVYDTTTVLGGAFDDPDFNRTSGGAEGTGADIVHYRIPTGGYSGFLTVTARIWYQSLPPKWMAPIFEFSSPEIDSFKAMFNAADRTPVLVAQQVLDSVYVTPVKTQSAGKRDVVTVTPSLTADGRVRVSAGAAIRNIRVWNTAGTLVLSQQGTDLQLPPQRGVYFVSVETSTGIVTKKVVRQ